MSANVMRTWQPSPARFSTGDGETIDFAAAGLSWYGQGFKLNVGEPAAVAPTEERDVLFGSGSALTVRRAVFDDVGGFDERYFMFFEDVDLGWRLWLLGHRVRYVPHVRRVPQASRVDVRYRAMARAVPPRAKRAVHDLQELRRPESRSVPARRDGAGDAAWGHPGRVDDPRSVDMAYGIPPRGSHRRWMCPRRRWRRRTPSMRSSTNLPIVDDDSP